MENRKRGVELSPFWKGQTSIQTQRELALEKLHLPARSHTLTWANLVHLDGDQLGVAASETYCECRVYSEG